MTFPAASARVTSLLPNSLWTLYLYIYSLCSGPNMTRQSRSHVFRKENGINMGYCCAFCCTNGAGSGRVFHAFPKDQIIRQKWIILVNRVGWQPTKWSKLCSDHFACDAYDVDPAIIKSVGAEALIVHRRLKPGAVPSIFQHKKPLKERKSRAMENAKEVR